MTPRENALIAYHHGIPEYVPSFHLDCNVVIPTATMEQRNFGPGTDLDGFGVQWTWVPGINGNMVDPSVPPILEDITQWREVVKFPNVEEYPWEEQYSMDAQGNNDMTKLQMAMVASGPFERLHALMGMEEAMMALMTDPEECYAFFGAVIDYKIAVFKKIKEYYNVDVFIEHDDYGANDRMLMSPTLWRSLMKPHLKRLVDATHELGALYEHHSCGFVEPIIGDLVEIGVDALNSLQACNTNVGQLKKQYGSQLTFVGGFDSVGVLDYPGVTEEAIRADYHRVLNLLAPGGSYICAAISAKTDYLPILFEEHNKYGMTFYKEA